MTTFKGVHFDFEWSPAITICGANDSGKSNILEVVGMLLSADTPRRDIAGVERWITDEYIGALDFELHSDDLADPDVKVLSWIAASTRVTQEIQDRVDELGIDLDQDALYLEGFASGEEWSAPGSVGSGF